MLKLSILIPSIVSRGEFLTRILDILRPQLTPEVEVVINLDACGRTVGEKRNSLLQSAEGEYVSFIDDDDVVSPDYIAEMMAGISLGVDVVAIRGEVTRNGFPFGIFIDTPHQKMANIRQEDGLLLCLRGTQHLDAIKREIALSVPFEPKSFGEDSRWTASLEKTGLINSWHLIEKPLYIYHWVQNKTRPVIPSRI